MIDNSIRLVHTNERKTTCVNICILNQYCSSCKSILTRDCIRGDLRQVCIYRDNCAKSLNFVSTSHGSVSAVE